MSGLYGNVVLHQIFTPLMPYLDDPQVREIAFNKPGEFWVLTDSWSLIKEDFFSHEKLNTLAVSLSVFDGGKPVTNIMSRVGPKGERIQIVKAPACHSDYFGLNIRKHVQKSYTVEDIANQGAFSSTSFMSLDDHSNGSKNLSESDEFLLEMKGKGDVEGFIRGAIEYKKNIIFVGATGSGKTTFFRAIADLLPRSERIITIEDTHELFLESFPNKIHLMFGKSELSVTPQELLESAMRMTPDRILYGELRGHEAWDYLQSLNTGHPGSMTTVHANSALLGYSRIAFLIKQSPQGNSLSFDTILEEVMTSIDCAIYLESKKVKEIFYDPMLMLRKIKNQN